MNPETQEFQYYGQFVSEHGIEPITAALKDCSWPVEMCRSGFDGTLYLRSPLNSEIYLEMVSGQSKCFLFGGDFEGTLERGLALLGDFSRCLTAGGHAHQIEIYDAKNQLVGSLQHAWT